MSPGKSRSTAPKPVAISGTDQLPEYFRGGEKPPENHGIGIEYEQIGVFSADLRPIPFTGERSIQTILETLCRDHGWSPVRESGHLIGLERSGSRITLEPGGQIELSGKVHKKLNSLEKEIRQYHAELLQASAPLGIVWMSIGLQPFARVDEIPWNPKERYRILSRHLASRGDLAHHMMKKTAGVQVNLDFENEADAMEKFRLAMGLSSLVTALFANSPISRGRPNGFMSLRAHIWTRTDPDRCGLLPFAFDSDLSYRRYTDYAIGVPSLWLVRGGRWHPAGGMPFHSLIRSGWRGQPLNMEDWALHLTSLFPEVRMKKFLEIRSSDSTPIPLAMAFAAFWKGVMYDSRARHEAWSLVETFTWKERLALHEEISRKGLRARIGNIHARGLMERLLAIAREGLGRQSKGDANPEAGYLDPAIRLVEGEGNCPGRILLGLWENRKWADRPRELAAYVAGADSRES